MEWCVKDYAHANHPPVVKVAGESRRAVRAGESIELDASSSSDADGQRLRYEWIVYPEASGYRGPAPEAANATSARATLTVPREAAGQSIHVIAEGTDDGSPPLTRYARVVLDVAK
jgi:hypothetical protein